MKHKLLFVLFCFFSAICLGQKKIDVKLFSDTLIVTRYKYIICDFKHKHYLAYNIDPATGLYCKAYSFDINDSLHQNGILLTCYTNGNVKQIQNLENGKYHGCFYEFYDNGRIKHIVSYEMGVIEGKELYIKKNGDIWLEINYVNGLFHGHVNKFFRKNNKLLIMSNYYMGLKEGLEISYFRNGQVMKETPYKNGRADGISMVYNRFGKLIRQDYNKEGTLVKQEYFAFKWYYTILWGKPKGKT